MGTKGELNGTSSKDTSEIEIIDFASGARDMISLPVGGGPQGYGGGDFGLMRHFVRLVQGSDQQLPAPAAISVQSHLMAFAAEKSRLEGKVIDMAEFQRLHAW